MLTADLRCSPNDTNTCLIAGLSVSCHSCTEALAISTCITRARVLHTVLIIWVWIHLWEHVMMLDSYHITGNFNVLTQNAFHLYLVMAVFERNFLYDATLYFCPCLSIGGLKAWVKAWRIALHPRTMGLIWLGFSRADVRLIPCLYALLHIRLLPVVHESAGRHSGFSSGGTL